MKNFPGNFLSMVGAIAIVVLLISFGPQYPLKTKTSGGDTDRIVPPFSSLSIAGGFDVAVKQGTQTPIRIIASDKDLPHIITEVIGNTLTIGTDNKGDKNYHLGKVQIEITIPVLYNLEIAGSGVVNGSGSFGGGKDMEFDISGSGTINLDVNADELEADIAGNGELILSGKAKEADIEISGSGNFRGEKLECAKAEISIAGSGNVFISVSDILEVSIAGSGNVYYSGVP
ncbi:MAG: head GIN domain-containing protein, partial [Chitinophagales bacterium]